MEIIAHVHNGFPSKFGLPRQSGLADEIISTVVFTEKYRAAEALRGIDKYSHLWILWQFHDVKNTSWSPTVRPPKLGGNTRVGVFATRSPYRPNNIALSSVRLRGVCDTGEGKVLIISGSDMMDGTPVLDIKPYIAYTDCHPDAVCGFAEEHKNDRLEVVFPPDLLEKLPEKERKAALAALSLDPRPAYHDDPERVYGFAFSGREIRFKAANGVLKVVDVG